MDILGLDVTWEAEFAEAGWILPWTGDDKQQAEAGTLAVPLQTATWKGQLYAVPYNSNTQLLWYRDRPGADPARDLGRDDQRRGAARQGGQAAPDRDPGRPVRGLDGLVQHAGRQRGRQHPDAERRSRPPWAARGDRADDHEEARPPPSAADPSLPVQMEDQNRLAMEAGTAAFELNYPFVYPSMKANNPELFKHFKWAPVPAGQRRRARARHHRRHRPGDQQVLAAPRPGLPGRAVPAGPGEPAERGGQGRPAAHAREPVQRSRRCSPPTRSTPTS